MRAEIMICEAISRGMMMLEFTKLVPKEPRGIVEGIEPRPGIDC